MNLKEAPNMSSIINEAWRKAEEIKREKEKMLKRVSLKKSNLSSSYINSAPRMKKGSKDTEGNEDLQAIVNAAWVTSRDKVFKKKRNSVAGNKTPRDDS